MEAEAQAQTQPKTKSLLREIVETVLLTAAIFLAVNSVTGRFKIYGGSMDNTFKNGQYIIVNRLAYKFEPPQRGDVIVLVPPGLPAGTLAERLIGLPGETDFIKRIIGMPGNTISIENGALKLNGSPLVEPYIREPMNAYQDQTWALGPDEYFVMGDNRNFSKDSRDASIGPINFQRIVGKVMVVYWPVSAWKIIEHYRYP
ncbi:MAG: signal peptidase I [Chloroflexota bacterium]